MRPVPVGAAQVGVMRHAPGLDPEPSQSGADRFVAPAVETDAGAGVDESSVPGARLLAVEIADNRLRWASVDSAPPSDSAPERDGVQSRYDGA